MQQFVWKEGVRSYLFVNGVKLEATCFGPPPSQAPVIVLLHEGLGCIELWRSFPKELARVTQCGVFVWSRAGYGASDPVVLPRPLDYMSREALDVLPGVLDALQVNKTVLLGHSDGASIAAIYAGSVQDHRIRGLVLMAPHFFVEQVSIDAIAAARMAYDTGELKVKLSVYHNDVDVAFNGWCDAWLADEFRDWNIADNIDYLRVPVLAIQGEQDQYGTMAQIEELERRCYSPVDTTILSDCKHSPHLEKTQDSLNAIKSFLDRLWIMEDAGGIS